jgi:hypothetical protein
MLKMKNKIISFAFDERADVIPSSAKRFIPKWYKNFPSQINEDIKDSTYKRCMPFLDSLTVGYIAELWCDLTVRRTDKGRPVFFWDGENAQVEERGLAPSAGIPTPTGSDINRFAWKTPYYLQTPPGYSVLITHPLNRFDLPFTTLSGVVDSENVMYNGNVPFFLKNDFEGKILKGTPIYQIIPFKRENWTAFEDVKLIDGGNKNKEASASFAPGWYKKIVWKKKEYK